VNRRIVKSIKEEGRKFAEKLPQEKQKIIDLIESQKLKLEQIISVIDKIEHKLNMLIHMEQASLVIHADERRDDLSDMIDVHSMPLEKFQQEIEHTKMMKSSFDILKVELEKQKEYIGSFNLSDKTSHEHYFFESEKLESQLSEEEIISVAQLKDFTDDLHVMVKEKLGSSMPFISESDKVALQMIDELKRIKLNQSFLSPSIYAFTEKFIAQIVDSHRARHLVVFLLFFLHSRLKKYKSEKYYESLRMTILCYNLLKHMNIAKNQRFIISGAALMSKLNELQGLKADDDESHVIKNYYHTANQLFSEEFVFMDDLLSNFREANSEETVPWIVDGARVMRLVKDFDAQLVKYSFNSSEIGQNLQDIQKALCAHRGCEREILYLLDNWQRLIPGSLLRT